MSDNIGIIFPNNAAASPQLFHDQKRLIWIRFQIYLVKAVYLIFISDLFTFPQVDTFVCILANLHTNMNLRLDMLRLSSFFATQARVAKIGLIHCYASSRS